MTPISHRFPQTFGTAMTVDPAEDTDNTPASVHAQCRKMEYGTALTHQGNTSRP